MSWENSPAACQLRGARDAPRRPIRTSGSAKTVWLLAHWREQIQWEMQSASGRLTTGPTEGDKHPETPFESAARPRACGFDLGLRHSEATSVWRALMCEVEPVQARPHRISWARLLKRIFDIDMQHCPHCGAGELKIDTACADLSVACGRSMLRAQWAWRYRMRGNPWIEFPMRSGHR